MRYSALVFLVLSGCASATMMEARGTSRYAPQNERTGGRVRYLQNGFASVVQARREDAYQQMYERCGGRYSIVSERDVASGAVGFGSATAVGNVAVGSGASAMAIFKVIDFECAAPAPRQYDASWKSEDEMAAGE